MHYYPYQTKEVYLKAPLNYEKEQEERITLFGRMIWKKGNHRAPCVVYLQGGPGFPSPRDVKSSTWLKTLLEEYRVFLPDFRGTGKSQKIDPVLAKRKKPKELAEYFSCHRAVSIVKDLELFRKHLRIRRWILLGQSWGGFVAMTYLSFYPDSLQGVAITGGLPPLTISSVKEVYKALREPIYRRNSEFYRTYPKYRDTVKRILNLLQEAPQPLSHGGKLTPRRFLDLGLLLGREEGPYRLALLLEDPFLDRSQKSFSFAFLQSLERQNPYEAHPIYAVLHESIYCHKGVSNWAAEKVLEEDFPLEKDPPYFHGEMIRREMFKEYGKLRPFQKAAELLAKKEWPPLYNIPQLMENPVPVEAVVYTHDYYVHRDLSLEAASLIRNCRVLEKKEWHHDALRVHGRELIKQLFHRLKKRMKK